MVMGIGTDLVEIQRMEKSLESPTFFKRVFGPEERAWLESLPQKKRAQSAAACFAAKEAFLKACGRGLGGFELCSIQTLRKESGEPYYELTGDAKEYLESNQLSALVSLSHEGGLAQAFALLQKETL